MQIERHETTYCTASQRGMYAIYTPSTWMMGSWAKSANGRTNDLIMIVCQLEVIGLEIIIP